jgi:hypothetical protein
MKGSYPHIPNIVVILGKIPGGKKKSQQRVHAPNAIYTECCLVMNEGRVGTVCLLIVERPLYPPFGPEFIRHREVSGIALERPEWEENISALGDNPSDG